MTGDASDSNLRIKPIGDLPDDFGGIIVSSLRESFYARQRMRDDWDAGTNRFDRQGEILLEARAGARLVGICGLNRWKSEPSSADERPDMTGFIHFK